MEKRVIVIAGPTCSGKTSLGLQLAQKLKTEIVSADSRQIYKHLTIGTAKPTKEEQQQVKHHFVDLLNPAEEYNASKFEIDGLKVLDNIHTKNKIPIVVGGSGLYLKALIEGIFNAVDTDENYRNELLELRKEKGNEFLYDLLVKSDPQSAEKMLPSNWKRVIRALEVYKLSGKPIRKLQAGYKRKDDYNFLQFALSWERSQLYKNIENRVDEMIESGLVQEVREILARGYSTQLNSLNTVGYKEIIEHLNGKISLERAVELIKRNTRRYAKRQLTWFRKDQNIKWFEVNSAEDVSNIPDMIITDLGL
ncbi:MAG: tRNA (adenosine(37)-N6)-dimethylallyltransferase MiaA [Ignavibacteriae bacterium]|nr:tRNA (adenosine(37)-N6)-dimethylallyltransferase MiaA [Ignavibacteriota bacterium]NOG97460.1 tRNA (adenosine(37)-N6)-dimethylallyltransferase MiaA [Ignavibacteriota bacterium]